MTAGRPTTGCLASRVEMLVWNSVSWCATWRGRPTENVAWARGGGGAPGLDVGGVPLRMLRLCVRLRSGHYAPCR
eukprot:11136844-Alexandrium_andersonii.AAC.1